MIFDPFIEFFDKIDPVLKDNLKQRQIEIGCLTDIFEKMNDISLNLQGNKNNFIKAKGVISSFIAKWYLQNEHKSPRTKSFSDSPGGFSCKRCDSC